MPSRPKSALENGVRGAWGGTVSEDALLGGFVAQDSITKNYNAADSIDFHT